MKIDAERLRGFLDCMHDEADERDKRSKAISDIAKAAKLAGYDTKAVRKVFVRERMDDAERARQDDLLDTYEGALGAKGRALADIRAGVPVGQAADRHGVHRATLARSRHVANEPSNATDHDPETGEVKGEEAEASTPGAALPLERVESQATTEHSTDTPKPEDGDDGITTARTECVDGNECLDVRCDLEGCRLKSSTQFEAPVPPSVGAVAAMPRVASSVLTPHVTTDDDLTIPAHLRGPSPANRRVV